MAALKHFSLLILTVAFASLSAVNVQHSPEMQSVINVRHAMSISDYTTISAITLVLHNHLLEWTKLNLTGFTIFAPIDSAFISTASGKTEIPSMDTILVHYSPVYLPYRTLRFLREIPTISLQYNLFTTSIPLVSEISIGFVKISPLPIYDDGCVIVYSVEQVFDIGFTKDKLAWHRNSYSNGTNDADPQL
ncbi:uncharacterized protein LOC132639841 [Lycium barbarum]|uniref:uncharacterized protein LOC132639841 n=1 Tax=Lycium barbarum TaxID=112863 RepID=UPI00293E20A0|nr:uncharacterized protein LOC132639841 [Lycium barbarum]